MSLPVYGSYPAPRIEPVAIAASLPTSQMERNPAFDELRLELGYDAAWQRWASATNESLDLAEPTGADPSYRHEDLATKNDVVLWLHFISIEPGCGSCEVSDASWTPRHQPTAGHDRHHSVTGHS